MEGGSAPLVKIMRTFHGGSAPFIDHCEVGKVLNCASAMKGEQKGMFQPIEGECYSSMFLSPSCNLS